MTYGYRYFFSSFDLAESAEKAAEKCNEMGIKLVSFSSKKEWDALK